jgi:hypothetical protein
MTVLGEWEKEDSANQWIGESGDQFDELGLVAGASLCV